MAKRIGSIASAVLLGFVFWYFLIKPYDYLVRFEVAALPGTINQTVKWWNSSLPENRLIAQEDLAHFTYEMNHNDSVFKYEWDIIPVHDSLSKVRVHVSNPENSFKNRLMIPFSETSFKKRTDETLRNTLRTLQEHLKRIRVTLEGEATIPESYCLCVPIKDSQRNKASGMMRNYSFLTGLVLRHDMKLNGPPFVEITDWDMEKDSIAFNFCNPIVRTDSLPKIPEVFYKEIAGRKALKARYNGNYITSDRAWYSLLAYAQKNNVPIDPKPFEVFLSNPSVGADELNWEADIYMPIKE